MEETSLNPRKAELPQPAEGEIEEPPTKKRKGPKGPNPLSMKKKKPKEPQSSQPHKDQSRTAASSGPAEAKEPEVGAQDDSWDGLTQGQASDIIEGQRKSRKRKRRKVQREPGSDGLCGGVQKGSDGD